ncbi:flagellar biosynthesis protein FlhB [Halioxenophilus sp. WMMB6]|uniref:flagellar biosynthesis protein FlhB n=1 Tax=Halioxenophilus sp. WMMB6 TaxID=3073815 RepID=UPI00295EF1CD|nr:flagellar biosynthesis protein FlhB [Halioxenophilus sp. WMMB6]
MAENDSSQERTEQPTPKRLEKAREEGQVPRSRELTTTALLLGATVTLYFLGSDLTQGFMQIFTQNLEFDRSRAFDTSHMIMNLSASIFAGLWLLVPFFLVLLVLSIVGPIALGGWLFSSKSMMPKFERLNPMSGLKRMFSVKALVELGKALGKVAIILVAAILLLKSEQADIIGLSDESTRQALVHSVKMIAMSAILLSATTVIIAALDIPFQMWDTNRQLKMSRQEIKDEMKDSEGKPEVKGRIRQLQRDLANSRMMAAVPEADVIITNPTHYSVALKYDPQTMSTPRVVAKGVDHIALKIREIAQAHQVEVVQAPALARAVYHTTDLDSEIPSGLYMAVAQVLAYIFQLRQYRRGKGARPKLPKRYPIPDYYQFDQ